MSFICRIDDRGKKPEGNIEVPSELRFNERLISEVFSLQDGKPAPEMTIEDIQHVIKDTAALKTEEFKEFIEEEGLHARLADMVADGYLISTEQFGDTYWVWTGEKYDAQKIANERHSRKMASRNHYPPPPSRMMSVTALTAMPELRTAMAELYFICNVYLTALHNGRERYRKERTDPIDLWRYALHSIDNLRKLIEEEPNSDTAEAWRELGVDFQSEFFTRPYEVLQEMEEKINAEQDATAKMNLEKQANSVVVDMGRKVVEGTELKKYIPPDEMYGSVPEETPKELSRRLMPEVNPPDEGEGPGVSFVREQLMRLLRSFVSNRFLPSEQRDKPTTASYLYRRLAPAGGMMNFGDFLSLLLESEEGGQNAMVRRAVRMGEHNEVVWESIPVHQQSMAGEVRGAGGQILPPAKLPIGAAANSMRQGENLRRAYGRRLPSRMVDMFKTGFSSFFDHILNRPITPARATITDRADPMYGYYGLLLGDERLNLVHDAVDAAASEHYPEPKVPEAPDSDIGRVLRVISALHPDDTDTDIALLRLAAQSGARQEDKDVQSLMKSRPKSLVFYGQHGGETLRGTIDDGEIVWRSIRDSIITNASPENIRVYANSISENIIGNARVASPEIDTEYHVAHYGMVEKPVNNEVARRDGMISEILSDVPSEDWFASRETGGSKIRPEFRIPIVAITLLDGWYRANGEGGIIDALRSRGVGDAEISQSLYGINLNTAKSLAQALTEQLRSARDFDRTPLRALRRHLGGNETDENGELTHPIRQNAASFILNYTASISPEEEKRWNERHMQGRQRLARALIGFDDRFKTQNDITGSYPGTFKSAVLSHASKLTLSPIFSVAASEIDRDEDAGGAAITAALFGLRAKPYHALSRIVAYDIIRSLLLESAYLDPSAPKLNRAIIGRRGEHGVDEISAFDNFGGGTQAAFGPFQASITGALYGYIGSMWHEHTHALAGWFYGFETKADIIGQEGRRRTISGEMGGKLSDFDAALTEIEERSMRGEMLTKEKDTALMALIIKAMYRTAYFRQFQAHNQSDIFDLLLAGADEDLRAGLRENLVAELQKEAEGEGTLKERRARVRDLLDSKVSEAIMLYRPSDNVVENAKQGGFGNQAFDAWYGHGKRSARKNALKFLNDVLLNKYNARHGFYYVSAIEYLARSAQSAYLHHLANAGIIIGEEPNLTPLVDPRDISRLEHEDVQMRRLYDAQRVMREGMVIDGEGNLSGFMADDLSALKSNLTDNSVMEAFVDLAFKPEERLNPTIAAVGAPPLPPPMRRLEISAYGEEAALWVRGDRPGEFSTIARTPIEVADEAIRLLSYVQDGEKTPTHLYAALLRSEDVQISDELAGALARQISAWSRHGGFADALTIGAESIALPDTSESRRAAELRHIASSEADIDGHDPVPPEVVYTPAPQAVSIKSGALNRPMRGMNEQNAAKPTLPSGAELAAFLGLSEEEFEAEIFPHGALSHLSLNTLQYETLLRFFAHVVMKEKAGYEVLGQDHLAQAHILGKKVSQMRYRQGFGAFIGTGGGKTRTIASIHKAQSLMARRQADAYLIEKKKSAPGLTHEQLWLDDGEYRRIVSRGVTVFITGGASPKLLNRGARKAMIELQMLPDGSTDEKLDNEGIVEGDGYRFINGLHYTNKNHHFQKENLRKEGVEERQHIPQVGDVIFYESYNSFSNDNYKAAKRIPLPPDLAYLKREKDPRGVGQSIHKSMAREPGANFRRLTHIMGIDGGLADFQNNKTGIYDKQGRRPPSYYDVSRYLEFEGNIIFDEADTMTGLTTQGYSGQSNRETNVETKLYSHLEDSIRAINKKNKQPSAFGVMGRELTRLFPNAHVIYATATPLKNISSFAAYERLVLPDLPHNADDTITPMLAFLHQGGEAAEVDWLRVQSERGAIIRAALPPAPTESRMANIEEQERIRFAVMLSPYSNLYSGAVSLPRPMQGDTPRYNAAQIRQNLGAALAYANGWVSEAVIFHSAGANMVRQMRAEGKSIVLPVADIGSAHDADVIRIEKIESVLEQRPSVLREETRENDEFITAPSSMFGIRRRISRQLYNALPMFKSNLWDSERRGESTLFDQRIDLWSLWGDDITLAHIEEPADGESLMAQSNRITESLDMLSWSPAIKIVEHNGVEKIEFSISKETMGAMRRQFPGRIRDDAPLQMVMTPEEIAEKLKTTPDNLGIAMARKAKTDTSNSNISDIAIGVRNPEMLAAHRSAMASFPPSQDLQMLTTQMDTMLHGTGDYFEGSGREYTMQISQDNPDEIILHRRDKKRGTLKSVDRFQNRAEGGVFIGNPESMGRGIDLDWQRKTGNQQPRVMLWFNPPNKANLTVQMIGRINRGSTVEDPNAALIVIVQSNLPGMSVKMKRVLNAVMELYALSTGDARQSLEGAGIRWSLDIDHERTAVESVTAVKTVLENSLANNTLWGASSHWSVERIMEQIGAVAPSTDQPARAGQQEQAMPPPDAKMAEALVRRLSLLPEDVAGHLSDAIEGEFVREWNKNPEKSKPVVMNGKIKNLGSLHQADNIVKGGVLYGLEYTPSPVGRKFSHAFAVPESAQGDQDSIQSNQLFFRNQLYDSIYAINMFVRRPHVIVRGENDIQYRAFMYGDIWGVQELWVTLDEYRRGIQNFVPVTRSDAEELWEERVENPLGGRDTNLLFAIVGNPASFNFPREFPITPAVMPDPENPGEGTTVNAYLIDVNRVDTTTNLERRRINLDTSMRKKYDSFIRPFSVTAGELKGKIDRAVQRIERGVNESDSGQFMMEFALGAAAIFERTVNPTDASDTGIKILRVEDTSPRNDMLLSRLGKRMDDPRKDTNNNYDYVLKAHNAAMFSAALEAGTSEEKDIRNIVALLIDNFGYPIGQEDVLPTDATEVAAASEDADRQAKEAKEDVQDIVEQRKKSGLLSVERMGGVTVTPAEIRVLEKSYGVKIGALSPLLERMGATGAARRDRNGNIRIEVKRRPSIQVLSEEMWHAVMDLGVMPNRMALAKVRAAGERWAAENREVADSIERSVAAAKRAGLSTDAAEERKMEAGAKYVAWLATIKGSRVRGEIRRAMGHNRFSVALERFVGLVKRLFGLMDNAYNPAADEAAAAALQEIRGNRTDQALSPPVADVEAALANVDKKTAKNTGVRRTIRPLLAGLQKNPDGIVNMAHMFSIAAQLHRTAVKSLERAEKMDKDGKDPVLRQALRDKLYAQLIWKTVDGQIDGWIPSISTLETQNDSDARRIKELAKIKMSNAEFASLLEQKHLPQYLPQHISDNWQKVKGTVGVNWSTSVEAATSRVKLNAVVGKSEDEEARRLDRFYTHGAAIYALIQKVHPGVYITANLQGGVGRVMKEQARAHHITEPTPTVHSHPTTRQETLDEAPGVFRETTLPLTMAGWGEAVAQLLYELKRGGVKWLGVTDEVSMARAQGYVPPAGVALNERQQAIAMDTPNEWDDKNWVMQNHPEYEWMFWDSGTFNKFSRGPERGHEYYVLENYYDDDGVVHQTRVAMPVKGAEHLSDANIVNAGEKPSEKFIDYANEYIDNEGAWLDLKDKLSKKYGDDGHKLMTEKEIDDVGFLNNLDITAGELLQRIYDTKGQKDFDEAVAEIAVLMTPSDSGPPITAQVTKLNDGSYLFYTDSDAETVDGGGSIYGEGGHSVPGNVWNLYRDIFPRVLKYDTPKRSGARFVPVDSKDAPAKIDDVSLIGWLDLSSVDEEPRALFGMADLVKSPSADVRKFAQVFGNLALTDGSPYIPASVRTDEDAMNVGRKYLSSASVYPDSYIAQVEGDMLEKQMRRIAEANDNGDIAYGENAENDAIIDAARAGRLREYAEAVAARINDDRNSITAANASYLLQNEEIYRPTEAALLLRASTQTSVNLEEGGDYRVSAIRPNNRHLPLNIIGEITGLAIDMFRVRDASAADAFKEAAKQAIANSRKRGRKFGNKTGWVKFGKSDNAKDAEELSQACMAGSNTWCIRGGGTAASGLSRGDFHLYYEKGQPEIALRFEDDKLAEIAGAAKGNQGLRETRYFDVARRKIEEIEKEHPVEGAHKFIEEFEYKDLIVKASKGNRKAIEKLTDKYLHIGNLTYLGLKDNMYTLRLKPTLNRQSAFGHDGEYPNDFLKTINSVEDKLSAIVIRFNEKTPMKKEDVAHLFLYQKNKYKMDSNTLTISQERSDSDDVIVLRDANGIAEHLERNFNNYNDWQKANFHAFKRELDKNLYPPAKLIRKKGETIMEIDGLLRNIPDELKPPKMNINLSRFIMRDEGDKLSIQSKRKMTEIRINENETVSKSHASNVKFGDIDVNAYFLGIYLQNSMEEGRKTYTFDLVKNTGKVELEINSTNIIPSRQPQLYAKIHIASVNADSFDFSDNQGVESYPYIKIDNLNAKKIFTETNGHLEIGTGEVNLYLTRIPMLRKNLKAVQHLPAEQIVDAKRRINLLTVGKKLTAKEAAVAGPSEVGRWQNINLGPGTYDLEKKLPGSKK